MTFAYVIFSIDNEDDPRVRRKFEGDFEDSVLTGSNLIKLIGAYKGETENAYLARVADFDAFVKPMGFVANQESILRVSECNKRYAVLEYLADGTQQDLGCLKDVPEAEAKAQEAWSYRPDIDVYWIAIKGNPDHTPKTQSDIARVEKTRAQHEERCKARKAQNV